MPLRYKADLFYKRCSLLLSSYFTEKRSHFDIIYSLKAICSITGLVDRNGVDIKSNNNQHGRRCGCRHKKENKVRPWVSFITKQRLHDDLY